MRALSIQTVMPNLQHKPIKVLVIEDDPLVCLLHKGLLMNLGCQVEVSMNAEEALLMLDGNYDLILLDIELPNMSGIEFSLKLRHQPKYKSIPIIAITSSMDENIQQKCFSAGIRQVLRKPVDLETLELLLKSHHVNHIQLEEIAHHSAYRTFRYE